MRTTLTEFFVLLIAVLLMNQIAFGSQPELKGDRLIGHGISEGAVGFGKAFALAQDAGLEFIEFSLTEFSVDDKTRQDGRLEPEKISNLIIADPAAVHNKTKGIRTLWVSDLIFK